MLVPLASKVDPIVQTDFGVEIVKVFFPYTGAEASSEAEAPPRGTYAAFAPAYTSAGVRYWSDWWGRSWL